METIPFSDDLFYEPFFKDEEGFKADLWLGAFFVGIEPLSFFQKIKAFRCFTGETNSALMLAMLLVEAKKNNSAEFLAFQYPSSHPSYKNGESLFEKSEFSRGEFMKAMRRLKSLGYYSYHTNKLNEKIIKLDVLKIFDLGLACFNQITKYKDFRDESEFFDYYLKDIKNGF